MDTPCNWTQARIDALSDGTLSVSDGARLHAHLTGCRQCAESMEMARVLQRTLVHLDPPMLPSGFSQRLSARLRREAAHTETTVHPARPNPTLVISGGARPWWMPFGAPVNWAGAAVGFAALLLWVGVEGPSPLTHAPQPHDIRSQTLVSAGAVAGTPVRVSLGDEVEVRIWFESDRDLKGVRFALQLPPGVEMVRDGIGTDRRSLTWEGDLARGRNVIPLRVRGVTRGEWTVTASVERGGAQREQSVSLRVDDI